MTDFDEHDRLERDFPLVRQALQRPRREMNGTYPLNINQLMRQYGLAPIPDPDTATVNLLGFHYNRLENAIAKAQIH